MIRRITGLIVAVCCLGVFSCGAYRLMLRNTDGSERFVELSDKLAMSVEGDNLVVHSPDGRVECELPALHGFRYVENTSTGTLSVADDCSVTIGSDCMTVAVGDNGARCEVIDMSGMVVLNQRVAGQETISFSRFQQGVYAVLIDGVTIMKFAVR